MRRFFNRIKWLLWKKRQAFKASKLVYAFTDLNGHDYYRFENQDLLSMERLAELKKYFTWILRGLTNDELNALIAEANQGIIMALQSIDDKKLVSKYLANVISHHAEIQMRSEKISNCELYYNLLAVQYIRHDEDPLTVSETIQREKVIAFKSGAAKPNSFFFAMPEFQKLCKLLSITANEWTEFQELSLRVQQRNQSVNSMLKERLSKIGSGSKSS
jgi:hypothetical protein